MAAKIQKRNWPRDIGVALMLIGTIFALLFAGGLAYRLQRAWRFAPVVAEVMAAAEKCDMEYKSGKRSYQSAAVIACEEVEAFRQANSDRSWRSTRKLYLTIAYDRQGKRLEQLLPATMFAEAEQKVGQKPEIRVNPADPADIETMPGARDWLWVSVVTVLGLLAAAAGLALFRKGLRQGG